MSDKDKAKAEAKARSHQISEALVGASKKAAEANRLLQLLSSAPDQNISQTHYKTILSNLANLNSETDTRLGDFANYYSSIENLNGEISVLRRKISDATSALAEARAQGRRYEEEKENLTALIAELRNREDLGFLLTRVNAKARSRLVEDQNLRDLFTEDQDCNAFVMSVDIRRSTELMLKARSASLFADFISAVTKELHACVVSNIGVFDKFTGDGVLAFFPQSFSGDDFGYRVVKAAHDCHIAFEKVYRDSRSSFTSVLKGIGLGIGIDYGTVRLLRVAEGLTVVGVPVVYACRLSGCEPGKTLLNQPAYEEISTRFGKNVELRETSLEIKHEGEVLAYSATLGHSAYQPCLPGWEMQSTGSDREPA